MSLTISMKDFEAHTARISTAIGPGAFDTKQLVGFFTWFDKMIRSQDIEKVLYGFGSYGEKSFQAVQNVLRKNRIIFGIPPFINYEHRTYIDVPKEVAEVFTQFGLGDNGCSVDQLTELLNSLITVVACDVSSEPASRTLNRAEVAGLMLSRLGLGIRVVS